MHFVSQWVGNLKLNLHLIRIWFTFIYYCSLKEKLWYFQIIIFCDNFLIFLILILYFITYYYIIQSLSTTTLHSPTFPFFCKLILKTCFDSFKFNPIYHPLYNVFDLFVHMVINLRYFIFLMSFCYFFHYITFLYHLR